jgi:hypothetical protein
MTYLHTTKNTLRNLVKVLIRERAVLDDKAHAV